MRRRWSFTICNCCKLSLRWELIITKGYFCTKCLGIAVRIGVGVAWAPSWHFGRSRYRAVAWRCKLFCFWISTYISAFLSQEPQNAKEQKSHLIRGLYPSALLQGPFQFIYLSMKELSLKISPFLLRYFLINMKTYQAKLHSSLNIRIYRGCGEPDRSLRVPL